MSSHGNVVHGVPVNRYAFGAMNISMMKRTMKTQTARGTVFDEEEYDDGGGDTVISYDVHAESLCCKVM